MRVSEATTGSEIVGLGERLDLVQCRPGTVLLGGLDGGKSGGSHPAGGDQALDALLIDARPRTGRSARCEEPLRSCANRGVRVCYLDWSRIVHLQEAQHLTYCSLIVGEEVVVNEHEDVLGCKHSGVAAQLRDISHEL